MSIIQFFYNLLFPLVFLLLLPSYLPRMFKRGGYQDQFLQRLGVFDKPTLNRIGKGRLWVHAVSVGETFIALKFIHHWKKRHPEARFVLSITTTTALELANKQASDWLEPIANPIDFFILSNAMIKQLQPSALIMIEGDVWPQRLLHCKEQGIPTAIITARLSPRSESRLHRFCWLTAPFFNVLDLIGVPSEKDRERWLSLGINPSHLALTGNIKFDQQDAPLVKSPSDAGAVMTSLGWGPEDPILLAGSTGGLEEEKIIVEAWLGLKTSFPHLRLIMAPRHAERREEIQKLFTQHNIKIGLRSEPEKNSTMCEAFLLDTTGELNSWYTMASIVFIGKSLGVGDAHGGQNPVEPLVLGKPVLVGPSMENFEPLISELLAAQGVLQVRSVEEIIETTKNLLSHPEQSRELVQRGLQTLDPHQGATDRTCILLEKLLKIAQ